jgi:hypothetical protein
MKSMTCVYIVQSSEAFSRNQTGKFSLLDNDLRGLFFIA